VKKNNEILNIFGRRIKELRQKKGFTSQISLANKAGIDRTYIGGIERGERNVALININKIAKALEVTLGELFRF
jgi:transcriptional regulator with XRE-family HTH domain